MGKSRDPPLTKQTYKQVSSHARTHTSSVRGAADGEEAWRGTDGDEDAGDGDDGMDDDEEEDEEEGTGSAGGTVVVGAAAGAVAEAEVGGEVVRGGRCAGGRKASTLSTNSAVRGGEK